MDDRIEATVDQRMSVPVPADRLRVGDRVAAGRVAFAEYVGWMTGLNSVQIGFGEADQPPVFVRRPGAEPGIYFPGSWTQHAAPDEAAKILARPTLMDEHYSEGLPG